MLVEQEREIGGRIFKVKMLDSKRARGTLLRFSKLAGPALAELAQGDAKSILDLDTALVFAAIARFFMGMSEEDLEHFVTTFRTCSKVVLDGGAEVPPTDSVFDTLGTLVLFKWLVFALEVNYSDFLDEAKTHLPAPKPKAP